jgi:hypothetical protein
MARKLGGAKHLFVNNAGKSKGLNLISKLGYGYIIYDCKLTVIVVNV